MARATTSRSPARGGKGAGARKGASAKPARGAAKAVKVSAPKRTPKAAAKPVRASSRASTGAGLSRSPGASTSSPARTQHRLAAHPPCRAEAHAG